MAIKIHFKLKPREKAVFRESDIIFKIQNDSEIKEKDIEVNIK